MINTKDKSYDCKFWILKNALGTWEEHCNINMCGQGDVELIVNWK